MRLSQAGVAQLLQNSVLEVRFKRRHPKVGWSPFRRMLCTNASKVLNSLPGRLSLHYLNPKGPGLRFNPRSYNLAVAWDIFWQDYRLISLDQFDIVTVIPVNTPEDLTKWWVFFNEILKQMNAQDKISFMNK